MRDITRVETKLDYKLCNGFVFVDDGGPGQALERDQVIAFSDGSLFLKEQWDRLVPCVCNNDRLVLADMATPRRRELLPGVVFEEIRCHYGKDFNWAWIRVQNLVQVKLDEKTQTIIPLEA